MLSADARADIEALLTEYGWRIDHGENVGELFAADGVVIAPGIGLTLQGRDAIERHFAARAADKSQVTRHIWCDLRVEASRGDVVHIQTTQLTYLRCSTEAPATQHTMVGETRDVVLRCPSGEWRFSERHLEVIFPFDIDPRSLHSAVRPDQPGAHYEDGVLYYVKSRSGDVSVARYFARHDLFFAVGDAIGYFSGDLIIGKPVPLTSAFGND